jgi:His-Xaa-Ser system radical SAM maturase HxsB
MPSDVADVGRRPRFLPAEDYASPESYSLLPFRFTRVSSLPHRVLITTETGEYLFVDESVLKPLVDGSLAASDPAYRDLVSKGVIADDAGMAITLRRLASQYRSKKSFIFQGPTLFIFVVTLRCDHSCHYCQVSRRSENASIFDMTEDTALAAIDRLFESPGSDVTIEFQGGEPLLAFPRVRQIILEIARRAPNSGKSISFSMTTTLHHATPEILAFLKDHSVAISTSIDGPAFLHDRHRPNGARDAHAKTIRALEEARRVLGAHSINALATITRAALEYPEAIVNSYVDAGFRSIFLRPLSAFGFAMRSESKTGYPMHDFVAFYRRALDHIIDLNARGTEIVEVYASTLLTHIMTPHTAGYVDLRSPVGAGLGTLVFNYDGYVYPSDEARMLTETGDPSLRLGAVTDSYHVLISSPVFRLLLEAGIAETQPGCSDCAYLPYCGSDPVASIARRGAPIGHTFQSAHCRKHMALFDLLFAYISEGDPQTLRLFASWLVPQRH